MFLARELGRTVDELLSSISSQEITEWAAFYNLEREESLRASMTQEAQWAMRRGKRG